MNRKPHATASSSFALEAALLAIILLGAAGLRIHQLGERGLWLDEFWIAELSTGRGSAHLNLPRNQLIHAPPKLTTLQGAEPWHRIWSRMEATHPPLYFIVLRFWREAVGDDDVTIRALSVLASLAAIVGLYLAVRLAYSVPAALWAAALMAAAWPQIGMAQEARSYAFLTALGAFALLCVVRLRVRGPNWVAASLLGGLTLAMLLTHYFAAGAAMALGIAAIFSLAGRARWQALTAIVLAGVLFTALWGPSMWSHRHLFSVDDPATVFLRDEQPNHILRTVVNVLAAAGGFLDAMLPLAVRGLIGAAVLFAPVVLIIRRRRMDLLPWAIWTWCVLLVLAGLDLLRGTLHLTHLRYTLLAAPAAYALLAAMLWNSTRPWLRHLLPALALLLAVTALPRYYAQWQADVRVLVYDMRRHIPPGEPIIFAAPPQKQWQAGAMFLQTSHYLQRFPGPIVMLDQTADESLRRQLRGYGRIWLIDGWDPAPLQQLLPEFDVEAQITYGGVGRLVRLSPFAEGSTEASSATGRP